MLPPPLSSMLNNINIARNVCLFLQSLRQLFEELYAMKCCVVFSFLYKLIKNKYSEDSFSLIKYLFKSTFDFP
jgi:hypothetical protein